MGRYIFNLTSHLPDKTLKQEDITKWLIDYHPSEAKENIDKYAIPSSMIKSRGHYEGGIGSYESNQLFCLSKDQPSLRERNNHLEKISESILDNLYDNRPKANHLIHVTCTYYSSPSVTQKLISKKKWNNLTTSNIYHMGCYASLPAINSARHLCETYNTVDIIHTEFCSYHLDTSKYSSEQIIVKTLFADGVIKYSVSNEPPQEDHLEILSMKEIIVHDTEDKMSWNIGDHSFSMTLSKRVPFLIKSSIKDFFDKLCDEADLKYEDLKNESLFAIHPGGPKIIEYIQKELDLKEWQVEHSKKILQTRGNMSSATLPHIWDSILKSSCDKKYVFTVAFGPGLTITGALFKLCLA